ncbi:hypothetical protein CsSME_00053554 [Camellia sinensis var. sinensis]
MADSRWIRRLARGAGLARKNGPIPLDSWNREAVSRAAMVALSSSLSGSQSHNRGCVLNREAQATIQVDKALGMQCEGCEEDLLLKCVELEKNDANRTLQKVGVDRP